MRHLTRPQREAIERASQDRLSFASQTEPSLSIAGVSYPLIKEPKFSSEDGPAVVLEVTVVGRLKDLEFEECRLDYVVSGETCPAFLGEIAWMRAIGYETRIIAATESFHAETTPLGKGPADDLSFVNAEPSEALYEVASRLDYPDIDIVRTPRPRFTRSGGDNFSWTNFVSEVYEAVRDETGLILRDTPLGKATGRPETTVLGDEESVFSFTEGVDFHYGDLSVKPAEEGRYSRVVVYRQPETGSRIKLAERKVDNHGKRVRDDAAYMVELTAEDEVGADEKAYQEAVRIGDNSLELEWPVLWPPFFLWRGEPVRITGNELTPDGVWVREYRARLTANTTEELSGSLKATGTLISETFERKSTTLPVAPSQTRQPLIGYDHIGRPYVSTSLSWASYDNTTGELVLDPDKAAAEGVTIYEDPATREVTLNG